MVDAKSGTSRQVIPLHAGTLFRSMPAWYSATSRQVF